MISNKKGLKALSPLFLLLALIAAIIVMSLTGAVADGKSVPVMPLTVAFLIASIYAIAASGGMPLTKRIDTYSRGQEPPTCC